MKNINRTILCALLIMTMLLCCAGCGKDTSGLGSLEIGTASVEETLAPLGGSDTQEPDSEPEPTTGPVSEPEPTAQPTPEPEPSPESGNEFIVDSYSCDCFDCYIPYGWKVDYKTVDVGNGVTRIYVFVQDPTDSNNIIFFVSAQEPLFTSLSEKEAVVRTLTSAYEWSPVLDELSAAGVLEQWASLYTLMDATGFDDGAKYFRNYSVQSILCSEIADGSSSSRTDSQALAEVTIPGASGTYGILYSNSLVKMSYPYANASYYISYSNQGFVLSADRFSAEAEGMIYCASSFDFTKFNNKYGSSGITAGENGVFGQEVTLPEGEFFAAE